jgi:hypothetical protein
VSVIQLLSKVILEVSHGANRRRPASTPLGLLHRPLGQIAFAQLAGELVPFVPHPTRRSDDAIPRSHADRKIGHLDREPQRLSEVRALSRAGLIETTSNASIGTNRRVPIGDGCSTKRVAGLSDGGSCCDRTENASQKNDSAGTNQKRTQLPVCRQLGSWHMAV